MFIVKFPRSELKKNEDKTEDSVRTDVASWNLFSICVDKCGEADVYGRLYTTYAQRQFQFYGIHSLLLQMEQIFDAVNVLQATTRNRSFRDKKKPPSEEIKKGLSDLPKYQISSQRGEKATFLVQVAYRQNATWQGTVTWLDKNKKQHFRSALELIRIIDSVTDCNTKK